MCSTNNNATCRSTPTTLGSVNLHIWQSNRFDIPFILNTITLDHCIGLGWGWGDYGSLLHSIASEPEVRRRIEKCCVELFVDRLIRQNLKEQKKANASNIKCRRKDFDFLWTTISLIRHKKAGTKGTRYPPQKAKNIRKITTNAQKCPKF